MRRIAFSLVALLIASASVVAQTRPAEGLYVEVFVRGEKRDAKVAGKLTRHDAEQLTIETPAGVRELSWDQLTPTSGFTLKARLIDRARAADWLELGRWAWQRGLEPSARVAFGKATQLDASMASVVAKIVATPSGSRTTPPVARIDVASATPASEDQARVVPRPRRVGGQAIERYAPSTPEADAAAIALARQRKAEVERILEVKLAEVATDHFLIFTDWEPDEHGFLKAECEGAYRIVATQFDRPATENVFVGKLPVYMFARHDTFLRFANDVEGREVGPLVLGYFAPVDSMGHMAMWKPSIGTGVNAGGNLAEAKVRWGRTLIHEFCHAFIHRYRTNVRIPRWLNEGTAEVISEDVLPTNNYYQYPRIVAQQRADVSVLFDEERPLVGESYPVLMSFVEFLAQRDRKAFLAMFNDIKDGASAEDAMFGRFRLDRAGFVEAWRAYARELK